MSGDVMPASKFDWEQVIWRTTLSTTTKVVAQGYARFANPDGSNAYPGRARLAAETGLKLRTVEYHTKILKDLRAISPASRRGVPRSWRTAWRLTFSPGLAAITRNPAEMDADTEVIAAAERRRYERYHRRDHPQRPKR